MILWVKSKNLTWSKSIILFGKRKVYKNNSNNEKKKYAKLNCYKWKSSSSKIKDDKSRKEMKLSKIKIKSRRISFYYKERNSTKTGLNKKTENKNQDTRYFWANLETLIEKFKKRIPLSNQNQTIKKTASSQHFHSK